jgi:hypothetical protein
MAVCIEHPGGFNQFWQRRYIWLKLSGTGRVAIQSAFKHWEDPPLPVRRSSSNERIIYW